MRGGRARPDRGAPGTAVHPARPAARGAPGRRGRRADAHFARIGRCSARCTRPGTDRAAPARQARGRERSVTETFAAIDRADRARPRAPAATGRDARATRSSACSSRPASVDPAGPARCRSKTWSTSSSTAPSSPRTRGIRNPDPGAEDGAHLAQGGDVRGRVAGDGEQVGVVARPPPAPCGRPARTRRPRRRSSRAAPPPASRPSAANISGAYGSTSCGFGGPMPASLVTIIRTPAGRYR